MHLLGSIHMLFNPHTHELLYLSSSPRSALSSSLLLSRPLFHSSDLKAYQQKAGETMREYISCFSKQCNWKCNQALIVGFGDNDHTIRELMSFIEMTSRESIIEDVIQNGGSPNYDCWRLQTQRRFNFLLYFEFEYRKSRTIKGDTMLKPTCATKCSILHSSILKSSAMIACSTLFYLCYQAWCGTATTYLTVGN